MTKTMLAICAFIIPLQAQVDCNAIIFDVSHTKPSWCIQHNSGSENRVLSIIERKREESSGQFGFFRTYIQFAGNWQIEKEDTLNLDEVYFEYNKDMKEIFHKGKRYLYFSANKSRQGTMYNGFGWISICLFDLSRLKLYNLDFSGELKGSGVDGTFGNLEILNDCKECREVFEVTSKSHPGIYKKKKEDYDLNNIKNIDKKWISENPGIYDLKKYDGWKKITMPKYKKDLFLKVADYGNLKSFAASVDEIENRFFKIQSSFKGPIVGYNKIKKEYFTVYIPPGMGLGGAWGTRQFRIKFAEEYELHLENSYKELLIDLSEEKIKLVSEQE